MRTIGLLKTFRPKQTCFFLFFFFLLAATSIYAQEGTGLKVTGRVTDAVDNQSLPGVNIYTKGTQNGCITDVNGNYSITVPKGSILVFKMVGYETQEIKMENQLLLNVSMKAAITSLDEVVVIGYGTTTKKEITGSISTVKQESFNQGSYNNPIALLQGKVAGLSIVNPDNADPLATYNIILRGTNTLTSGQGPLIIVNGVSDVDLKTVSPEEIESIDVLKDGSAAAIYGTRGSNGVIIVTTKQAKAGVTKVEFSGQLSAQVAPRGVQNLNASEFKSAIEQYAPDKIVNLYGSDVNWFKEITNSLPFTQQYNLAVSGGSDKFSHRTTLYVDLAQGLLKTNTLDNFLAKTNINQKAFGDALTLDYNLSYGIRNAYPANYDVFYQAFIRNPTSPVYDYSNAYSGGYTYLEGVDYYNPVAMLNESTHILKTNDFNGNVRGTLRFNKHFNWSNLFAYNLSDWEETYYYTKYYPSRLGRNGQAEIDNGRQYNLQYESTLNYSTSFGKSSVQALAGYTFQQTDNNSSYIVNSGFDSDYYGVNNIGAGSALAGGTAEMGSYRSQSRLISFFGRAMYNYDEKYLLSVSLRREGSSRFGENHKWGWFPAASLGWRMNRESFLKDVKWVNDLKLRLGFGVTGNQDFDNYKSLTLMGRAGKFYYNGEWINTYQPVSNPNPDLRWEKKQEFNTGVDFSFLKNRIGGSIDYYYRWSTDLLYTYTVSVPPYLTDQLYTNVGTVSNQGVELTLNAVPVQSKKFTWNTTLTFSKNVNKLVKFSNSEFTNKYLEIGWLGGAFPLNCQRLQEGQAIGTFYGPVYLGVDETGHDKFKNQDPVGHVSPDKWEKIGNANPFCTLGWSNSFKYKTWDLNFAFRAQIGGDVLNMYRLYYENWQSIGKNIVHSQLDDPGFIGSGQYSSKYIEDATFLKLDNITLGYNFPKISKYISNLRVFATAQNVFCLTGYKGLDPEVNISGLTPGIDYLTYYPKTTTITFGVNASF